VRVAYREVRRGLCLFAITGNKNSFLDQKKILCDCPDYTIVGLLSSFGLQLSLQSCRNPFGIAVPRMLAAIILPEFFVGFNPPISAKYKIDI